MDWNTLASALLGGILGGGLGSWVAYMSLRDTRAQARRDRQWLDAETVADARQLLKDIDPRRRGINLNRDPGVEDQRWAALNQRSEDTYKQLVRLAAGHPMETVQSCAEELSSAILRASYQSQWYVKDLLADRWDEAQLGRAQEEHENAEKVAAELERAVKAAGTRSKGAKNAVATGAGTAPGSG